TVPPLPREEPYRRDLPATAGWDWLRAGWRDFSTKPALSVAYGFAVFLISLAIVWSLYETGQDYILFPALAGFMVIGPFLAIGLYEKSRRLARREPVTLGH